MKSIRNRSLLLCGLLFLAPSIGLCTIYEFYFEGVVSGAMQQTHEELTYNPPQYYVGQSVTGSLYWHSYATPDFHYGPNNYEGNYSVEGDFPLLWAGIHVGDMYFNLNQNAWLDIGIRNGDDYDSLGITRVHTSGFSYEGHSYAIDLPEMHLFGPTSIFEDSSYPSYLDLSLFTSGGFSFANFSLDDPFYYGSIQIDITRISAVPEPATLLLLGAGIVGLAGYSRKKLI